MEKRTYVTVLLDVAIEREKQGGLFLFLIETIKGINYCFGYLLNDFENFKPTEEDMESLVVFSY